MPEELEAVYEVLSRLSCPFYRGVGICDNGCRDEPSCQVDEPDGGWLRELKAAVADLEGDAMTVPPAGNTPAGNSIRQLDADDVPMYSRRDMAEIVQRERRAPAPPVLPADLLDELIAAATDFMWGFPVHRKARLAAAVDAVKEARR